MAQTTQRAVFNSHTPAEHCPRFSRSRQQRWDHFRCFDGILAPSDNIMVNAPDGNTLLLPPVISAETLASSADDDDKIVSCLLHQHPRKFTAKILPLGFLAPIAIKELFGLILMVTQCFKRLDEEKSKLSRHLALTQPQRKA
ncbi:hypothetical protein VZT92_012867 [Zoarces viviparus]|uniref:Uncharacterized protein n=1 Tax=Zoarces viviparus TaxID=48416 RepID=A0AAW1F208_ZOAVI